MPTASPKRPMGVWPMIDAVRSSVSSLRFCSAGKNPGQMAFTRIPCGASSRAITLVAMIMPAFETE